MVRKEASAIIADEIESAYEQYCIPIVHHVTKLSIGPINRMLTIYSSVLKNKKYSIVELFSKQIYFYSYIASKHSTQHVKT